MLLVLLHCGASLKLVVTPLFEIEGASQPRKPLR